MSGREPTEFDELLPQGAVVVEARPDMWTTGLLPAEQILVSRAVPKRVREFTAGRNCARAALEEAGLPVEPILMRRDRSPIFPPGVTGTITHTDGYCAAAVMHISEFQSIGIDAELNEPLPEGTLDLVSLPCERQMLDELCTETPVHWPRLLFSIKEAFYKAYFQIAGTYLDFHEALVRIDPERSKFVVTVRSAVNETPLQGVSFCGRYRCHAGLIFSAIGLPHRESPYRVSGLSRCHD